eukprot:CAMPEP_0204271624 /NCGR_PEP_ID=MMETSP0468-20130131/20515_1 /ASSEMBLY_ACC=CAM_ASM_000383 /TAXON_ID=2969 /ORGANISM="Oxyrrhis marina" /LENGTH=172 /DNA_ID=CAMNT_0051247345 /DNA_START=24 /DNA_END=539 /DNA_ORIENTATION=-
MPVVQRIVDKGSAIAASYVAKATPYMSPYVDFDKSVELVDGYTKPWIARVDEVIDSAASKAEGIFQGGVMRLRQTTTPAVSQVMGAKSVFVDPFLQAASDTFERLLEEHGSPTRVTFAEFHRALKENMGENWHRGLDGPSSLFFKVAQNGEAPATPRSAELRWLSASSVLYW